MASVFDGRVYDGIWGADNEPGDTTVLVLLLQALHKVFWLDDFCSGLPVVEKVQEEKRDASSWVCEGSGKGEYGIKEWTKCDSRYEILNVVIFMLILVYLSFLHKNLCTVFIQMIDVEFSWLKNSSTQ